MHTSSYSLYLFQLCSPFTSFFNPGTRLNKKIPTRHVNQTKLCTELTLFVTGLNGNIKPLVLYFVLFAGKPCNSSFFSGLSLNQRLSRGLWAVTTRSTDSPGKIICFQLKSENGVSSFNRCP